MRIVEEVRNRKETSLRIKRWDLLAYNLSYSEQVMECCLTQSFYLSWSKPGFMDTGRKMMKFCAGKLALRKIKSVSTVQILSSKMVSRYQSDVTEFRVRRNCALLALSAGLAYHCENMSLKVNFIIFFSDPSLYVNL